MDNSEILNLANALVQMARMFDETEILNPAREFARFGDEEALCYTVRRKDRVRVFQIDHGGCGHVFTCAFDVSAEGDEDAVAVAQHATGRELVPRFILWLQGVATDYTLTLPEDVK